MSFCVRPSVCKKCGKPLTLFEGWHCLECEAKIEALEQEPKTGHWITQWNVVHQKEYYYCSECREEFSYDGETGIKMNDYKYCPNCGARMAESEE